MKRVAIITRTKDRPVFLQRALRSVASQSFDDYVHVIVNDGGDPETIERLIRNMTATQRGRTEVFHRPEPSNAPDTIFNESIDLVKSEFVVIHDDDDTWHEDFLKLAVSKLEKNPVAAGVVVRTDKVTETVKNSRIKHLKNEHYMPNMRAISLYQQCLDNQLTPISFLYRRKAYEDVGKYDASLPVVGDWEFGIRLLSKYDVEYIDPGYALAYYHHRKEGGNSFAAHDHRKYITKVCNDYLRRDLEAGKIGVGYIMNDLRHQQDNLISLVKKLLPTFATKIIRNRIK